MAKAKINKAYLAATREQICLLTKAIADIDARVERLNEEKLQHIQAKVQLEAFLQSLGGRLSVDSSQRVIGKPITTDAPEDSPYRGLALPACLAKNLEMANERKTPRRIWSELEAAGVTTSAAEPVTRVQWELRERARKVGDVVLVGDGEWMHRKYVSDSELAEIQRHFDGQAGRDRKLHSERTKAGMATLKARNVPLGAPKKMTEDTLSAAARMLLEGAAVEAVARELKVSKPSIYQYFKITRHDGAVVLTRKKDGVVLTGKKLSDAPKDLLSISPTGGIN